MKHVTPCCCFPRGAKPKSQSQPLTSGKILFFSIFSDLGIVCPFSSQCFVWMEKCFSLSTKSVIPNIALSSIKCIVLIRFTMMEKKARPLGDNNKRYDSILLKSFYNKRAPYCKATQTCQSAWMELQRHTPVNTLYHTKFQLN